MKGPGYRITNDVRRVWTCPKCGRTRRLPGVVVSQRCDCETPGVWMSLTAEPARRGFVVPRLVEPAELPKADEPGPVAATTDAAQIAIPIPPAATEAPTPTKPPDAPRPVPEQAAIDSLAQSSSPTILASPLPANPPPQNRVPEQPPKSSRRKRNRGRRRKRNRGESPQGG